MLLPTGKHATVIESCAFNEVWKWLYNRRSHTAGMDWIAPVITSLDMALLKSGHMPGEAKHD